MDQAYSPTGVAHTVNILDAAGVMLAATRSADHKRAVLALTRSSLSRVWRFNARLIGRSCQPAARLVSGNEALLGAVFWNMVGVRLVSVRELLVTYTKTQRGRLSCSVSFVPSRDITRHTIKL